MQEKKKKIAESLVQKKRNYSENVFECKHL